MADVYVNSEELREIAQSMKLKANNIMEAYQNEASAAILMGSESIQVSGLDTTALLNSLSKIFNNLNGRIVNLSDFLTNVVANEYDSVSIAIKNEFDNNFANEIAGLLGISVLRGNNISKPSINVIEGSNFTGQSHIIIGKNNIETNNPTTVINTTNSDNNISNQKIKNFQNTTPSSPSPSKSNFVPHKGKPEVIEDTTPTSYRPTFGPHKGKPEVIEDTTPTSYRPPRSGSKSLSSIEKVYMN